MAVEPTSGAHMQRLHKQLNSFTRLVVGDVILIKDTEPIRAFDEVVCIHVFIGGYTLSYAVTQRNARQTHVHDGVATSYYEESIRVQRFKSVVNGWADAVLSEKAASALDSTSFLWILKTITDDAKAQVARGG